MPTLAPNSWIIGGKNVSEFHDLARKKETRNKLDSGILAWIKKTKKKFLHRYDKRATALFRGFGPCLL